MLVVNRRKKKSSGAGILNSLINALPFGLELPGFTFCGPGTKIDQLRNVPGKNPLDEACKKHDLLYEATNKMEKRHEADRELIERAWERFKSSDASFSERAAALLIVNLLKAKVKLGAGVQKTPCAKKSMMKSGRVVKKPKVKKATAERIIKRTRVIPLPKRGGILEYLLPLLTGLSNVGSLAATANELLKSIQKMKGSGLKKQAELAPFKQGFGLYLKPWNPNE